MKDNAELIPFDRSFVDCHFDSHNDFLRKTGMNRATFYSRIDGGWWVRMASKKSGRLVFDLLSYKDSFNVQA